MHRFWQTVTIPEDIRKVKYKSSYRYDMMLLV